MLRFCNPVFSSTKTGIGVAILASFALGGCNMLNRLAEVDHEPKMSQIQNPTHAPQYTPVSMPMPRISKRERAPNSLWRHGARAFFKDQRAAQIGDLLTVTI
jgi:flagellar L-ring protein precursor FlgH